ncbi:MAG: hypothetical protein ACRDHU_11415, partial [Actinomycetota bacterium]
MRSRGLGSPVDWDRLVGVHLDLSHGWRRGLLRGGRLASGLDLDRRFGSLDLGLEVGIVLGVRVRHRRGLVGRA